ncbi:MAG: hypothetical protein JRJ24_17200 [Deltaproteobacteria bacterium]|nr:hypothetical protein [Deltaproteobacteria bacterium]
MRYLFGFLCLCTLGVVPLGGCGDQTTINIYVGTGGVSGNDGGGCEMDVCPCTEQGIRDAIAKGGGPYTFTCEGPTTVVTEAEITINNDVILDGEGNFTVDGNDNHPVFSVAVGVTAELRGFAVTRGLESGILNNGTLTISNSVVSDSGGGFKGGGILNVGGATMMITNTTVSGNRAGDPGGGVANDPGATMTITNSTVTGNTASEGGGVHNWGTLTMTGVVVSANSVSPGASEGEGGGVANWGTLVLTNSTLSGNDATAGGGGIYNSADGGGGTLVLVNSTVSGNSSGSGADGIFTNGGSVALTNSIVDDDCDGDITSNGYNIESPGNTCGFDQVGDQASVSAVQLDLGPLADNGGLTETHALLPGSVAINQIPEAACEVDTDQRGVTRPQGPACDVGAFEVQP